MKCIDDNVVASKSKEFAIRCVKLYTFLKDQKQEYVLSKQILRSGTSIGANIKEAMRGQSQPDFRSKMNIALKEASETEYWIEILEATDYLDPKQAKSIKDDYVELIKLLTSIVKNSNE